MGILIQVLIICGIGLAIILSPMWIGVWFGIFAGLIKVLKVLFSKLFKRINDIYYNINRSNIWKK